ncbi:MULTISPECIES: multicopper oxidase family protein [unclassified Bradyrhizobium]|uniref:multicopper oxidase family protein n=1 Tax=unclassified Bradyrhizobium TaxID=2631580 RepID=UPI002479217C|nr:MULTISPECIES: multicopper oxidase family protein [unclassified Bradyrhizobium]WGS21091.1 multicopper oxidase family protein [Bradyrhizobium sp. ISRA463]WGS28008.1 multicopper oxidase family protein [Bradyrhizobium sp. ISRA464]
MSAVRTITRRSLLVGSASLAAGTALPLAVRAVANSINQVELTAAPGRARMVGRAYPATDVWCYGDRIPGPEIRVRQGERVRIVVHNQLPEETTVHWHGIRLPNAMDGVPGLTQPPIKPGEQFTYEFTPPDAGTFWYHPHADSLKQLGRGLAGALIVEEAEPVAVDRDLLCVISDWRLTSGAQIAAGFGNAMEAAMSGRVGNTVTINGTVSEEVSVRAGERIRLRLVNAALARIMALRFEDHRPVIVAIDGQPCEPHEPKGDRLLLGPAMRLDVVLDMQGEPGRRYRVIDDFDQDLSYWLTHLAYDEMPPIRSHPPGAVPALPRNPLPEPDLASAERHELRLQGGMMGGGAMMGLGGTEGIGRGASWAINGTSMVCNGSPDMPPSLVVLRGRSCVLTFRNETAWWHPMHLHGSSFQILSRNGSPEPHRQWADTVLVTPRETVEVAFVADNPGDWMLHCHVADHQVSGLMTVLRII